MITHVVATFLTIMILAMFGHYIGDFCLQTNTVAKYKQKVSWYEIYDKTQKKYVNGYKVFLFWHSFSWAFTVMVTPLIPYYHKILQLVQSGEIDVLILSFAFFLLLNTLAHYFIDTMKANPTALMKGITMLEDQIMHIVQLTIISVIYTSIILGK